MLTTPWAPFARRQPRTATLWCTRTTVRGFFRASVEGECVSVCVRVCMCVRVYCVFVCCMSATPPRLWAFLLLPFGASPPPTNRRHWCHLPRTGPCRGSCATTATDEEKGASATLRVIRSSRERGRAAKETTASQASVAGGSSPPTTATAAAMAPGTQASCRCLIMFLR